MFTNGDELLGYLADNDVDVIDVELAQPGVVPEAARA